MRTDQTRNPLNRPCDESAHLVRRFSAADADGVVALVRQVYGSTYIHAELYNPADLVQRNDDGRLVSAVAVDGNGAVVGHYALERPDLGPVAETGEGMVSPEHRGHHLFPRLRSFVEAEARRLKLFGLTGRPTTSHVYSQKVYREFDCHPTGLELARASGMSLEGVGQITSCLMYFKFLDPPPPATYHVPQRHQQICRQIAARTGRQLTFAEGKPAHGQGRFVVEYDAPSRLGRIHVLEVGQESFEAIDRARSDLRTRGVNAVFLRLPLADPATADLCDVAERGGFFFNGVDPRPSSDGDVLQLQSLMVEIDSSNIHVEGDFAREVMAYVLAAKRVIR